MWWNEGALHRPTLTSGALLDYLPELGKFRAWAAAPDRDGNPISFGCRSASSGAIDTPGNVTGHQFVAMEHLLLDYDALSGSARVLHCPPLAVREGIPGPSCRKLAYASWPTGREAVYLGLGRVMAWERATQRFDLWSFARRGSLLRNASGTPFQGPVSGRLAGVHNASLLLHMRLPQHASASASAVNVVIEVLGATGPAAGRGTYRVWNSEGWSAHVPQTRGGADAAGRGRSPLAGPVGRGTFPPSTSTVTWTSSSTVPALLELDPNEGAYRTIGVSVVDFDTLHPATSNQPPLHMRLLGEGVLDQPMRCDSATTRPACAAMGGSCGWCEETDAIHTSRCLSGGPARPCADDTPRATPCSGGWSFFDQLAKVTPPPTAPSPPPPSPPGLAEADLHRLELQSLVTASTAAGDAAPSPPRPRRLFFGRSDAAKRPIVDASPCVCPDAEALPIAPYIRRSIPDDVVPPSEPCPPGCVSAGGAKVAQAAAAPDPEARVKRARDGGGVGRRLGGALRTLRQRSLNPWGASPLEADV